VSAFLCNPGHIGRVAAYAAAQDQWGKRTAQDYAELWARANLDSVAYRYEDCGTPDKTARRFGGYDQDIGAAEAYVQDCKRAAVAALLGATLTHIQAYKMLQCLDYQACEVPNWWGSEPECEIRAAQHRAVMAMPGYEEAPWEWRAA
jgi:hypothetical protein